MSYKLLTLYAWDAEMRTLAAARKDGAVYMINASGLFPVPSAVSLIELYRSVSGADCALNFQLEGELDGCRFITEPCTLDYFRDWNTVEILRRAADLRAAALSCPLTAVYRVVNPSSFRDANWTVGITCSKIEIAENLISRNDDENGTTTVQSVSDYGDIAEVSPTSKIDWKVTVMELRLPNPNTKLNVHG